MLNLFKSKKESGKSPNKSTRKGQPASNRTGSRTSNGDSKSWFSKPTKSIKSNNIKDVQIKPISASSPALNNNNENRRSNKRPLTVVEYSNVTLKRGQQSSKIEAQTPEDLSRSSSITNLNADQKGKGAKPKKAESKDRLDKVAEKKHDKNRTLSKNNNKELVDTPPDSLADVEAIQKQLAQMANDKSHLALQLGEQTGQLNKLQNEIAQLKLIQEESNQKIEQLMDENNILRNRLRDVAHSPLSDSEKQQLLYESHRHHNSAPASIATNLLDDGGDITTCPTPEWDKHSSSNVSEVSVACLQDKINQMQETHYSTNEELQATLQELTDLQRQLTELQQENLRINDEKNLMFESLCRQTERLNDSRNEVESLKQLLYREENGQFETAAEREQKLVDLLKSAQEERETLLMKQEQLNSELEDSRSDNIIHSSEIAQLTERVKTLESTLDAKHAEHRLLDQELAQAKDQSSSRQIEIDHLKDLLENAKTKITELEQDRALSDKSELDELLDNARKEKDALESEVARLKEQLALSKNEIEKLREQVSILQEECKVIRNNAKTTQSDLEYKLDKLLNEKSTLTEQLQQFQEAVNELQVQTQCQLDDKRQLSAVLSETQRNLNESERRVVELESELTELKRIKQEQEEEWEKFQNDLLTSVRVANDFKTEAQQDLQKLIMENKSGRDRIKQLEAQVEKLKGGSRRKIPNKHLSNEETLMASLTRRYKEIENLPDDKLTEEQKAVKVLKKHYESDVPRQKPVAHKPKDKLAISKPSLESVISNPKLEKIVSDSHLKNVESVTYFSDEEHENRKSLSPTSISLIEDIGNPVDEIKIDRKDSFPKQYSDSGIPIKSKDEVIRSKSLSDLPKSFEEKRNLQRYDSVDNLAVVSKNKKARKKSTVNLDTLEKICNSIDPNTPEEMLTKEQRLALRLRDVLYKEGKKATLKKNPKLARKKVTISRPTKESVESNIKLRQIINDPVVRTVGSDASKIIKRDKIKTRKKGKERYSMPVSPKMSNDSFMIPKKSKSYNDITFKFEVPNMYSEQVEKSFDINDVLPPKEFRDAPPSIMNINSVFNTFQCNNNTFKKEHNYLEVDNDDVVENRNTNAAKLEELNIDDTETKEEYSCTDDSEMNNYETFSQTTNEFESGDQDHSTEEKVEAEYENEHYEQICESVNEIIAKQLQDDDDLIYDFDEEEKIARRGTRQRYSVVIVEMKEKFDKSSDEETENDILDKPLSGEENNTDVIIDDVSTDRDSALSTLVNKNLTLEEIVLPADHIQETLYTYHTDDNDPTRSQFFTLPNTKTEEPQEELHFDKESSHINKRETEMNLVNNATGIQFVVDTNELDKINENFYDKKIIGSIIRENDTSEKYLDSLEKGSDNYINNLNTDEISDASVQRNSATMNLQANNDFSDCKEKICDNNISCLLNPVDHSDSENDFLYLVEDKLEQNETYDKTVYSKSSTPEANTTNSSVYSTHETKLITDSEKLKHDIIFSAGELNLAETYDSTEKSGDVLDDEAITYIEQKTHDVNVDEGGFDKRLNVQDYNSPLSDSVDGHYGEELEEGEHNNLHTIDDLTDEEIKLVQQYSKRRHSRPLSDIKLEDLAFIDELREKYSDDSVNIDNNSSQIEQKPKDSSSLLVVKTHNLTPNDGFKQKVSDDSGGETTDAEKPNSREIQQSSDINVINTKVHDCGDSSKEKASVGHRVLSPTKLHQQTSYEPVYANFYISSNRKSEDLQHAVFGKKPIALPRMSSLYTDEPIYREFGGQVRKTRFSITCDRKKGDSFKEKNQEKSVKVKDLKDMFERKSKSDFSRLVSEALEDS